MAVMGFFFGVVVVVLVTFPLSFFSTELEIISLNSRGLLSIIEKKPQKVAYEG